MHIELIRALRFSTSCGTLGWGILHDAGTKAEVPDADGKTMVECGEAIELVEVVQYEMVTEEVDGPPGKGGVATKIPVKKKVATGSTWVPKGAAASADPDPAPAADGGEKEPEKPVETDPDPITEKSTKKGKE